MARQRVLRAATGEGGRGADIVAYAIEAVRARKREGRERRDRREGGEREREGERGERERERE